MKLREKLEKLMVAISFAEANCPKEAKFFLQESKKQNNLRPEKKFVPDQHLDLDVRRSL